MPSSIAAKARAEAEAAEAEDAEAEENEEPAAEPEPGEPEPAEATDPAEGLEEPSSEMLAALAALRDEYLDSVRATMGGFVEGFVGCETCNALGLVPPGVNKPRLEMKPGTRECELCKGAGELGLPTKREGFEKEQCTKCNGKGWLGPGNETAEAIAEAAVASFPSAAPVNPDAPPAPPASTDPRVAELVATGRYIVMEKPGA